MGDYIPAEVSAAYIPIVGALVEGEASDGVKLTVALIIAAIAALAVAAAGRTAAIEAAEEAGEKPLSLTQTLRAGAFEIAVAPIAFLAWAAAIPSSFVDLSALGGDAGPIILVGIVALLFGVLAVLFDRPTSTG